MVVQSTKITLKQIQMRAGIKVRVPEQPQEFRAPGQSYKGSGRDGNVGAQRSPSSSGIKPSSCRENRAGRVSTTRPCSYRSVGEDRSMKGPEEATEELGWCGVGGAMSSTYMGAGVL